MFPNPAGGLTLTLNVTDWPNSDGLVTSGGSESVTTLASCFTV